MRILIGLPRPRANGGAAVYVRQISQVMKTQGWDVALLARDTAESFPGISSQFLVSRDIPWETLESWKPNIYFSQGWDDSDQEALLIQKYPAFYLAHDYKGMCISGHKSWWAPTPRPCSRPLGSGCLLHYFPHRCGGLNPVTLVSRYLDQTRLSALFPHYRGVITLSQHMGRMLERQGLSSQRVHPLEFWPEVPAPKASGQGGPRRLGYAGRIEQRKGIEVMVNAIAALRPSEPMEVEFVGEGDFSRTLDDLISRTWSAPLTYRRLPWMDRPTLLERIQTWDVMVFPSQWPEPLGLAGMEATQLGVPVAAFDVGGVGEWLQPGANGALAPGNPPSTAGLTSAIEACLQMKKFSPRTVPGVASHVAELGKLFQAERERAASDSRRHHIQT